MLKNAGEKISRVFHIAVIALLSAQILTGCLWALLNCNVLQPFPDTAELVKLSGTLRLKDDTGIIYPSLLILIRALFANGPVKFYHVMYLLQIVLGFAAWYVFAKNVLKFDSKYKKVFFALAAVTNPFAMQVHLAVLEYSFISSFVCLLVSYQVGFMREWMSQDGKCGLEKALRDMSVTSLFWLASALTRKEFILIGCIPVLALLITIVKKLVRIKTKPIDIIWPVVVALAFAGIICMGDSLFREGGRLSASGTIKRDLYYRVAWSENFRDRYHWPEYLTSFTDEPMMTHIMNDPGLVRSEFTEYVTERYGEDETSDLFYGWFKISFAGNKKQIVKETLSDIAGYIFAPAKTESILRGSEFPGFAAGNYDVMKQHNPRLTKFYLRAFSVLYSAAVLLCMVIAVLRRKKPAGLKIYLPALIIIIATAVCYSFQGCNVYDHRKVVFTTCMWIALLMKEL